MSSSARAMSGVVNPSENIYQNVKLSSWFVFHSSFHYSSKLVYSDYIGGYCFDDSKCHFNPLVTRPITPRSLDLVHQLAQHFPRLLHL